MPPTNRPSSRRTAVDAKARSESGRPASARSAVPTDPAPRPRPSARQPMPARRSRTPLVIGGIVVLAIAAGLAYRPVMRGIHLGRLDQGGAAGMAAAKEYLAFIGGSEAMVRDAVASNRGDLASQRWLAEQTGSIAALMTIAERRDLPAPELAATLATAVAVFDPGRHAHERRPTALAGWATDHPEREVAVAAMALTAAFAKAADDPDAAQLLAGIAGAPARDPLRVAAALDALAVLASGDNLAFVIGLMDTNAADQVAAHPGLREAILGQSRPAHVGALLAQTGSASPAVRALSLEALGGISLPANADPRQREEIGARIAAKLDPATPAAELAAALKAVQGLRLSGARDAVLALVPGRATLGLAGIDDAWWARTLGQALILSEPPAARPASEDLIAKLGALLDTPEARPVAARALGSIRDAGFSGLRPALDRLAALGEDPDCFQALNDLVSLTFQRADVAKANGRDLARWRAFLAQDRPRATRIREIIDWLAKHEGATRVTDGSAVLRKNKDFLDAARDYLQPLLEDPAFVPPLGFTQPQVKEALRRTNDLGRDTRNFLAGANQSH
jgi:hypothetical protein